MKVFGCKMACGYAGGLILVAANDVKEAYLTASKDSDCCWNFYDTDNDSGLPRCDYYPFEKWHEFEELSCKCTEPKVIVEDHYA